jgi:hypothetical protein
MTNNVIISKLCYQIRTPRVELTLGPRFYKFTTFVQAVKILYDVIKSDYKMTYSDVIGQIRFQIQTPGAHISLHTKFGPDLINFRKIDFRKSCYNLLTVKKFRNFNWANHAEFYFLSANISIIIPG